MESGLTPQAARILDCAQALIVAGGYNGFSYADISAEVGITKASIHHHFPRKSDLVRTLVQRYRAAAIEGLSALNANIASPLARLGAYANWWSTCIADGSVPICICAMLAAELPAVPEEVAAEVHLHFDYLAGWLEIVMVAGKADGVFALQASPRAEAQAFMATVHGAMLSARACGDPQLFESIMKSTLERLSSAR